MRTAVIGKFAIGAKFLLKLLVAFAAYPASAGFGMAVQMADKSMTPLIWLPAALGTLLAINGGWWGVGIVALGSYFLGYQQSEQVPFALLFSLGYTLGALATKLLMRAFHFQNTLERLQDVCLFLGVAVLLQSSFSAGFATLAISFWEYHRLEMPDLFISRWLADALAILVLSPLLLVWHANSRIVWHNRQTLEVLIWMAILIVIGAIVFRNWAPTDTLRYPLELSMFPLQAWAAVRFGQRGATTGSLIVSILAVWELQDVFGPDATHTITQPPSYLCGFVGVLAGTSLFLAAVMAENQNREDSISRNEARLRSILEAMPDISLVITESGRYVDVYAHKPTADPSPWQKAKGKLLSELHPPDVAARILQAVRTTIEEQTLQIVEFPGWHNEACFFEGRLSYIPPVAGEERKVTCVARDISARLLYEAQLRQARDKADAANLAKSEFLAIISHEIRTPMNAILGFTDILLQTETSPDQKEYLKIIARSGRDLLEMINNILDYTKIESRALELESTPFVLEDTVVEALELVLQKARAKGLSLDYHIEDETGGNYVGDPLRIRQILVNLVSNAVKFTREGAVQVQVRSQPLDAAECRITIAVKDTGIGIPREKLDRLFQPFSQIDSSTTREHGGSGLGLIITKRLAERMRGGIQVDTELGRGSTFTVTLILPRSTAGTLRQDALPTNCCDENFARDHPFAFQIYDQDASAMQLLAASLLQFGYRDLLCQKSLPRQPAIPSPDLPAFILVDLRFFNDNDQGKAWLQSWLPQWQKSGRRFWLVAVVPIPVPEEKVRCLNIGFQDYWGKPQTIGFLTSSLKYANQQITAKAV